MSNFNKDHRMLRAELYIEKYKKKRPFKIKKKTFILKTKLQKKNSVTISQDIFTSHECREDKAPFTVLKKYNLISKAIGDTSAAGSSFLKNKIR